MTKRDMTDAQFKAALERNNFSEPVLLWCMDKENPHHHYPVIYGNGKIYRRASLRHLLECRKHTEERKVQAAKNPPPPIPEEDRKRASTALKALNAGMRKFLK